MRLALKVWKPKDQKTLPFMNAKNSFAPKLIDRNFEDKLQVVPAWLTTTLELIF